MDFESLVTFEEKEQEKILVLLWTTQWRSQNTVADFTVKMFNLTGEGRKEMEFILMSSREVHWERPESPPSKDTWTSNQKGKESSFRFLKSSKSWELSLFWKTEK